VLSCAYPTPAHRPAYSLLDCRATRTALELPPRHWRAALAEVLARVPDGTWVKASVVLGNKAAEIPALRPGSLRFGPILVREVVGAPLVVEYDATRLGQRLLPFSEVAVEGRLVTFAVDRGELQDVAQWFERELRVKTSAAGRAIIVDEKPRQMGLYLGAWIAGLAAVVFSWGGILRRLRPR
jgi:hypothetical protein